MFKRKDSVQTSFGDNNMSRKPLTWIVELESENRITLVTSTPLGPTLPANAQRNLGFIS